MNRLVQLLLSAILVLVIGCAKDDASGKTFTVGFMPKLTKIPYFEACERGAEEAARELHINLKSDGPSKAESKPQIDLLEQWIHSGSYDCIVLACNDPHLLAPTLRSARDADIPVITFDADTKPDARNYFVNMADYDEVAQAMVDVLAEELTPKGTGKVAILTSSLEAPNQSEWARRIKAYVKKKYPEMELLPEETHGEDRDAGIVKARNLIQRHRDLRGIIGLTSVAVPAAAEAVRQERQKGHQIDVVVTGVSTPRDMRDYVKDGTVKTFLLWNPVDLGYLAIHVADLVHKKKMTDNGTIQAGRLGTLTVRDREVILGKPIRFNRDNIDRYDF